MSSHFGKLMWVTSSYSILVMQTWMLQCFWDTFEVNCTVILYFRATQRWPPHFGLRMSRNIRTCFFNYIVNDWWLIKALINRWFCDNNKKNGSILMLILNQEMAINWNWWRHINKWAWSFSDPPHLPLEDTPGTPVFLWLVGQPPSPRPLVQCALFSLVLCPGSSWFCQWKWAR